MMIDWNEYRGQLAAGVKELGQLSPDTVRGYVELSSAGQKKDLLGAKMRELIALAVAVTARCDGCITVHSEAAIRRGAFAGSSFNPSWSSTAHSTLTTPRCATSSTPCNTVGSDCFIAHGSPPSLVCFTQSLALVGVHASLTGGDGFLGRAALWAAVGETGLVRLQLELLFANRTDFDGESHLRSMILRS